MEEEKKRYSLKCTMSYSKLKIMYFYLKVYFSFYILYSPANASIFDWFWDQLKTSKIPIKSNGPFISVPFEYKSEDEKFIEEGSKFTDLMKTSSLDICQHKVILHIKTSCSSMTEEELAKMSVNLLNCQSEVDGRKVFICTDDMSLKECTKDMDANVWNAYHLMNNRARAVCLATRRAQFQALSEMTINKLMSTAHDQIYKMTYILDGQEKLENLTLGTLNSIEKGHNQVMKQQENIHNAQKTVHEYITSTLEQLKTEKAIIATGNKEISEVAKNIKDKLDIAGQMLKSQSRESSDNHKQLLSDIQTLKTQAVNIFKRIDSSTEKLLAQHELASLRYTEAIDNLMKINETVHYLLKIMSITKNQIDAKFNWIQNYLGGTENYLERLLCVTLHIIYLLVGMLFASFLEFSVSSRIILCSVVPLNLLLICKNGQETALNFSEMTALLIFTFIGIYSINHLSKYLTRNHFSENISSRNFKESLLNNKNLFNTNEDKNALCNQSSVRANKFIRNLHQPLSSLMKWMLLKLNFNILSSSKGFESTYDDKNYKSPSFIEYRDGSSRSWRDGTSSRDKYEESVHLRVNEWLLKKVDNPRMSTSTTTSETGKYTCSATCLSGRRCKNVASPGSDVCHKHSLGT